MVLVEICLLIVTLVFVRLYFQFKYDYWRKRNVPYITPQFPFGNIENPFKKTQHTCMIFQQLYTQFKERGERHVGCYIFSRPCYLIIDPIILKNVMLKDFDYFVDRGIYYNEKHDPLSAHLISLGGQKWRKLRTILSPTFTSGKIKTMFNIFIECTTRLKEFVAEKYKEGEPLSIKNVAERFAIDVIGSCAFGIECNCFKEESKFHKLGMEVFKPLTKIEHLKFAFANSNQKLARLLGIVLNPKDSTRFMMKVIDETLSYRQKNNVSRNDMLQILIDLKNDKSDLSTTEIAAQAFVFFLAGFETSSSTMTFCLYELAVNQDIQDRVRQEINSVYAEHENEVTYDAIMNMKYLQQVVDETLRKYPPAPYLTRKCIKEYLIPNTSTTIEEGTMVIIPVFALHRDPTYYKDPEKFDPERFSETNKTNNPPFTYIPFGEGPRLCIGIRFAIMEIKLSLTVLLRHYKFTLNEKTKTPLVFNRTSFVLASETPVQLNIEKI